MGKADPASIMGGFMLRIDLSYFYRLGLSFDALRRVQTEVPLTDVWFQLFNAEQDVRSLLGASHAFLGLLRSTYPSANKLLSLLDATTRRENLEDNFSAVEKAKIIGALDDFQSILTGELAVADAYFVVEKKGFNTIRLVSEGEVIFPKDIPEKVPEAVQDLREAAKCIAFELPMAAAFHIFRALEAVLRRYWHIVSGDNSSKRHSIESYIRRFKKDNCADPKIVSALEQLTNLHRNPLIHPQESVDLEEAMSIFGIAQSVMRAMVAKLPLVERPSEAVALIEGAG
jgi:hypothetical protein